MCTQFALFTDWIRNLMSQDFVTLLLGCLFVICTIWSVQKHTVIKQLRPLIFLVFRIRSEHFKRHFDNSETSYKLKIWKNTYANFGLNLQRPLNLIEALNSTDRGAKIGNMRMFKENCNEIVSDLRQRTMSLCGEYIKIKKSKVSYPCWKGFYTTLFVTLEPKTSHK